MSLRPNRFVFINDLDQLQRWWPFLREGMEYIVKETDWNQNAEDFFKFLLHVVSVAPDNGAVMVLVSGAGQPYGYTVLVNNTHRFSPKTINVYAIYSNRKCPSTMTELAAESLQWARSRGYKEAQACSYRTNGSAIRFFEKHMQFDRKFMVFTRTL